MGQRGRRSIPALTSLRFFAALLVVLFHYNLIHNLAFLNYVSNFGYEAVTFFFILSGFILTYVHLELGGQSRLNLSSMAFIAQRVARIGPAYVVGLVLAAPFFCRRLRLQHQISVLKFVAGLFFVPAALQAWFPSIATLWNIPAWSLSVEFFLYLSFPAFVHIACRGKPIKLLIVAVVAVVGLALGKIYVEAFVISAYGASEFAALGWWRSFLDYFPLWHFPQFALGVALGELFLSEKRFSPRAHEMIMAVSLFAVAAIIGWHAELPILSSNMILAPAFGSLIFGAAGAVGPLSRLLSARSLVLLGDASYATYIIHSPLWLCWDRLTRVDLRIELSPLTIFLVTS